MATNKKDGTSQPSRSRKASEKTASRSAAKKETAASKRAQPKASARSATKSQAVRAAIRALTREDGGEPLLRASGMIDGLPADLSARFDRYLEDTFVAEASAPYRVQPRRSTKAIRR